MWLELRGPARLIHAARIVDLEVPFSVSRFSVSVFQRIMDFSVSRFTGHTRMLGPLMPKVKVQTPKISDISSDTQSISSDTQSISSLKVQRFKFRHPKYKFIHP